MPRLLTSLALTGLVSLTACESQQPRPQEKQTEQTSEKKAPLDEEKSAAKTEEAKTSAEAPEEKKEAKPEGPTPPARAIQTHPNIEEFIQSKAVKKVDGMVDMFETYEPGAKTVASVRFRDKEQLKWKQSVVYVTRPRAFEATKPIKELLWAAKTSEEGTVEFAKGDKLYLYHYAGEGTCEVGWFDGDEFLLGNGNCPSNVPDSGWKTDEPGDSNKAIESQWWVLYNADNKVDGWIHVTDELFEISAVNLTE